MWSSPELIPESRRTHAQRLAAAENERQARRDLGLSIAGILAALYIIINVLEGILT